MKFEKPPLTSSDLLANLVSRGLIVADSIKAIHYIQYIGYYRLSGYCFPFQLKSGGSNHQFRSGTHFEDILALYSFDREFRLLLLDALERVEVAIRSTVSDAMSLTYGGNWYLDSSHFGKRFDSSKKTDTYHHAKLVKTIEESKEHFIAHHKSKYTDPIPSWKAMQVLSFGTVSTMFAHLKKRQINLIAQSWGLSPFVAVSWLHGLSQLRNFAAHHSRIWDRVFPHALKVDNAPDVVTQAGVCVNNSRVLFAYVQMIRWWMTKISPESQWYSKWQNKLAEFSQRFASHSNIMQAFNKRLAVSQ